MRSLIVLTLAFFATALNLRAQSDPGWIERFPTINIKEGDKSYSLKMNELHVSVEVMGNIARTTLDMTFANDLDRVLEGELYFPLGEGQTVSRYAMEMNGNLREAVPVEQEKARVAFENTVRQRIDPALLEWTAGNSFKSRVYPIPAKGTKRVVVGYEQELNHTPEGDICLLPLAFPDTLAVFEVKVQVLNATAEPKVKKTFLPGFLFKKDGAHYLAHLTEKKVLVNKPLEFLIPASGDKYLLFSSAGQGGQYFYTHITPSALVGNANDPKDLPNSLLLLWDASASAEKRDTAKTFAILSEYFRVLCDVEVQLMPFRNEPEIVQRFSIRGGKWQELRKTLTALPTDGGTCIGCVASAMMSQRLAAEAILLVSDGVFNIGDTHFPAPNVPVHTLSAQAATSFSSLKAISQASGGEFVNALELTTAQALALLTEQPLRFLRAEVIGNGTVQTWPSIPTSISDDGFSLAGFTAQPALTLVLHFGTGGNSVQRIQMQINIANSVNSGLVERMFAQKQLAELDLQYEQNKAQITALGKRYGLVTRNTSLLILDRVEDYVRYEIVPPADLIDEYNRLISARTEEKTANEAAHLQTVVAAFAERKAWWERDFSEMRNQLLFKTIKNIHYNNNFENNNLSLNDIRARFNEVRVPALHDTLKTDANGSITRQVLIDGNWQNIEKFVLNGETKTYEWLKWVDDEWEYYSRDQYSYDESSNGQADSAAVTALSGRAAGVQASATRANRAEAETREEARRERSHGAVMAASAPPPPPPSPRPAQQLQSGAINTTETLNEEREFLGDFEEASGGDFGGEELQEVAPEPDPSLDSAPIEIADFDDADANLSARVATLPSATTAAIALAAWTPNAPYLDTLKQAANLYSVYLKMRPRYENTPSFFLDVSDLVRAKGDSTLALRILTNIAELKLRDHALLRVLAHRLEQTGRVDLAIFAFREVLAMRGEDPQSYRDLALAYAAAGRKDSAARYLREVVNRSWDSRFPEIEAFAACELNALGSEFAQQQLPASLQHAMPCDLRVVLDWDTDNCDMDLWVTDPTGEKCYYQHRQTAIGGWISRDFTGGYGPEEFWIKTALKGSYTVQINYYGSRSQTLSGPTTVQARLITGYGTPAQKTQAITLRLSTSKEVINVGTVVVE